MTREEAIKALSLMEHVESIAATYEPGEIRNDTTVRELKEACIVAAAALRAQQEPVKLDGSRWERCNACSDEVDVDFFLSKRMIYCPYCGRPITEEAWAELERRIGGPDGIQ